MQTNNNLPLGRVLIAVDSSDHSIEAAKKGMLLAKKFNANVALIYVLETLKAVSSPELGYMASEVLKQAKNEAKEVVEKVTGDFHGMKTEYFLPEGNPWEQIIAHSESWNADLIMMGTHGRTGFVHLLMGSIAETVVQKSKVPVLVFPSRSSLK